MIVGIWPTAMDPTRADQYLAEGRNTTPGRANGRITWAQYLARR